MKRMIPGLISVLLLAPFWQTATHAQTPAPAAKPAATFQPAPAANGPLPTVAFDITKADIDFVLKNAPANPPDRRLRVVDIGKYNLGVGIIHRGRDQRQARRSNFGDLPRLHSQRVFIITSGSGVLTTGGVIENKRASTWRAERDERAERRRHGRRRRLQSRRQRR